MHEQCKAMCEALGGCAGVSAGAAFWPRANAESPPHIPSLLLHDAIDFAASDTTSTSARSGECHVLLLLLSFLPGSLRPSCKLVHFPPPPHAEPFTRSSSNKHTSWCTPVDPPGHVFGVTYRGIWRREGSSEDPTGSRSANPARQLSLSCVGSWLPVSQVMRHIKAATACHQAYLRHIRHICRQI